MEDAKTTKMVAEIIERYMAAVAAEDFPLMMEIMDNAMASPNRPFKKELARQLAL